MKSRIAPAVAVLVASVLTGCSDTVSDPVQGENGAPSTFASGGAPASSTSQALEGTNEKGATAGGTSSEESQSHEGEHEHPDVVVGRAEMFALDALEALPVKGRAAKTGYDRSRFGQEWSDSVGQGKFGTARNNCDTRNDVLARDLQRETVEENGCAVMDGVLAYEPYTGDTDRVFIAGATGGHSLDIDHFVSLDNAWVTGGQSISAEARAELANDPENLAVVDLSAARLKGGSDAASWLPANKAFRCEYVGRQINVKARYNLWVTAPERAAMMRVLDGCASLPLSPRDIQRGHTASIDARKRVAEAQKGSPSAGPDARVGGTSSVD